jgi:hypothetical protein
MSLRFRRRGLRATLTACAVTVGVLAGTSQLASAFVPCPTTGSRIMVPSIWETKWPNEARVNPKGVTLCRISNGGITLGYLQMVDLGDGARIRLHADVDPESPEPDILETNTRYRKRVAREWYTWLRSLPGSEWVEEGFHYTYIEPEPTRLFSITNATFFTETRTTTTTLPFPIETMGELSTFGFSWRRAHREPFAYPGFEPGSVTPDEDYEAPKKMLQIGEIINWETEEERNQAARVAAYPTHYEWDFELRYLEMVEYPGGNTEEPELADLAVSFPPEFRVGESNRRNYVGVYGDTVYIFITQALITNENARAMMQEIQPGMEVIQMDGGGSNQFYSRYGEIVSNELPSQRRVPTVLAVYRAP